MNRPIIIASLSADAQAQIRRQLAPKSADDKPSKYRNASVVVDGHRFPSGRESLRYLALKAEQARGAIGDLRVQPAWRIEHNGVLICDYVADFSYRRNGAFVVEDVKSAPTKTPEYRIKRKLMLAFFRVDVQEIE